MQQDTLIQMNVTRNLLIPLRDGVSLAADLYLPPGEGPFPTLISYYPYHKDDLIGSFLEYPRRYFVESGYANLLVDLRGLGGSEGVAWEVTDPREGEDVAEVVEWAALQFWCDGNVGMWGISYGGVTSLQAASRRPAPLKAIVPIYASVDVYHDLLYPGGCANCLGAYGTWGSFMLAMNLMPPGYQDPEGRWYRVWTERLATNQPYVLPWLDHPDYEECWRERAIPVEEIQIPTFLIGGWRDVFPEVMVQLHQRLSGPKKLLMGPWTHTPPDVYPFEPLDYLLEMKRWWDRWLKGEDNGVAQEPPVTMFVQGSNVWRHEQEWPIPRTAECRFHLSDQGLLGTRAPGREGNARYRTDPTVGVRAGLWDPLALGLGTPLDQGPDDLRSLTFTTEPLTEELEVSGSPELVLHAALERRGEVHLVAKLCHVAPDGGSSLITTGWLKGSHRHSHERPEPLTPSDTYEFRIRLWATSYAIPAGHRLRLSVSCSDFPRIWPTPTNPEIRVYWGGDQNSTLLVPVVSAPEVPPPRPEIARPDPTVNRLPWHVDAAPRWKVEEDFVSGSVTVTTGIQEQIALPSGGTVHLDHTATASVAAPRPDSAHTEGTTLVRLDLPASKQVLVESRSWTSQSGMVLNGKVTVDGRTIFEKQWTK